jgi:hypothetical protein
VTGAGGVSFWQRLGYRAVDLRLARWLGGPSAAAAVEGR